MSSTGGVVLQPPAKNHQSQNTSNKSHFKNTNNPNTSGSSKRKAKHDHKGRKRSKSFSGCGPMNLKPVPPTKFLLGGNINDPLNLNSLQNEEINRAMNAVTPKSSPIPTPPRRKGQIEVIIPHNIHDPLNLFDCADDAEYQAQMYSPVKKGRKKRIKKRRTVSACLDGSEVDLAAVNREAKTPETSTDSAKIPDESHCSGATTSTPNVVDNKDSSKEACKELSLELTVSPKKDKVKRKCEDHGSGGGAGPSAAKKFKYSMDKIVSPVVPQPGAWLKRTTSVIKGQLKRKRPAADEAMPQFKDKDKQFQYGNYNRYYGYRNPNNDQDHRLRVFSLHRYLFENKDILDIGCNIGHITLSIARDFGAKSVTGIDIDPKLIAIARKNVKHYVKNSNSPETSTTTDHRLNCPDNNNRTRDHDSTKKSRNNKNNCSSSEFFPISMPILYGSIDIPGFKNNTQCGAGGGGGRGRKGFPGNVVFKTCNYVLEDDALLALEQPQFDVILCLSTTKWMHLNWGDDGIKQSFRRMYAQLRPGGKLVLEPQNWASYKKKRKLTETIFKNYNSIEFFPEKFTEYLLSSVVGFAKSEILGYPHHQAKGFRRPIQIFTKSTMFLSERVAEQATPTSNVFNSGDPMDQTSTKSGKDGSHSQTRAEDSGHIYYTNMLNRFRGKSDENEAMNDEVFSEALIKDQSVADREVGKSEQEPERDDNSTVVDDSSNSSRRPSESTVHEATAEAPVPAASSGDLDTLVSSSNNVVSEDNT